MKPIEEITSEDLKDTRLLVFDVDGVLVPRGTKIKQEGRTITLETKIIADEQIEQLRKLKEKGFYININSGRSLFMLQNMFRAVLGYASLTYENGSATWNEGNIVQHVNSFKYLKGLNDKLETVTKHPHFRGFEPKEFIITIHCEDEIPQIPSIVQEHSNSIMDSYEHGLYCIWNGEAYDIGVKGVQTKGIGLRSLIEYLRLEKKNSLAIGDNLNDIELLSQAGIAVTADRSRVTGDFYVPLSGKRLPAAIMSDCILAKKL